jgi:hypothetical protein
VKYSSFPSGGVVWLFFFIFFFLVCVWINNCVSFKNVDGDRAQQLADMEVQGRG